MKFPNAIASVWHHWRLFGWRHARHDWKQALLTIAILSLGVGTFLSIRIANRASVEGFDQFSQALRGQSDWVVESPGGPLQVGWLREMRQALNGESVILFPVIETSTIRHRQNSPPGDAAPKPFQLMGVDLVLLQNLPGSNDSTALFSRDSEDAFWQTLRNPRHLIPSGLLLDQWGLEKGDRVELVLGDRVLGFDIAGSLPATRNGVPVPKNMAVMDIRALQRLVREPGHVDRLEVIVDGTVNRESRVQSVGEILSHTSNNRWTVTPPDQRRQTGSSMTAALRLNLTILSLIALVVGVYLIAQAMDASVTRRRREIATLRSLGWDGRQIQRAWLVESGIYGFMGSLGGILLGYLLSRGTIAAITTTVNALYQQTSATATALTTADFAIALSLGIGASLVAGWLPARDAAGTPPAHALRLGKRSPGFPFLKSPWTGVVLIILGVAMIPLPPLTLTQGVPFPVAGYTIAFLWLIGGTFLAASLLKPLGNFLHRFTGNSAAARMGTSRLRHPTSRHHLALAGFFIAIGMAAAMSILIGSFEHTVTQWLNFQLKEDVFISSKGLQGSGNQNRISQETIKTFAEDKRVRDLNYSLETEVNFQGFPVLIGAQRQLPESAGDPEILWKSPPEKDTDFPDNAQQAYASENFFHRFNVEKGDIMTLSTPRGERKIVLTGIYIDYSSDRGTLLIPPEKLQSWFGIDSATTVSLNLNDNTDTERFINELQNTWPALNIRDNSSLKEAALNVFHQTFAVTRALQYIGVLVALAGLVLTLVSLLRENRQELLTQHALGMSPREIANSTAVEGMGITFAGLIFGYAISLGLGYLLIFVINRQSFGWTLQMQIPLMDYLTLGIAVLALGTTFSWITGWYRGNPYFYRK